MDLVVNNKNVYVLSDIHNDADGFIEMLNMIDFSTEDLLIIDGDIFDRGNKPVELYKEICRYDNIMVIQGNHDVWVEREIREKYLGEKVGAYLSFGTVQLLEEQLSKEELIELARWIKEEPFFINLELDGVRYQIAHAQTYLTPERIFDKTKLHMGDALYDSFIEGKLESDKFVSIVGHTATEDRRIWKSESGRTIRIDCGAGYKSVNEPGVLGALRLNDMKEFYV